MRVSLPLLLVLMFPLRVEFFVFTHIWVTPIYVVNIVATVLVYVDIYVGLLPHILVWNYPLLFFGNKNLV